MDKIKLFDSELKLMEIVWGNEGKEARDLVIIAEDRIGWNKNTTYTILKKLVAKGMVLRSEPHFVCTSLVTKEQVQYDEARTLVDKLYDGSVKLLFSSFLNNGELSKSEREQIRSMIDSYDEGGE